MAWRVEPHGDDFDIIDDDNPLNIGYKKVLDFFSAKDEDGCAKELYDDTECGAWIQFHEDHIKIGSIVEGLDTCGTQVYSLNYKDITDDKIQEAIDELEAEADLLWEEVNGANNPKRR